jgi:hypothetical protein
LQLSEGHPICAVCGRGDLDTSFPEARGCYDTKVTSWRMALEMSAEAVNGPTTGSSNLLSNAAVNKDLGNTNNNINANLPNTKLPEFNWEKAQKAVGLELLHRGQPERFNFKFERQSPGTTMMENGSGGCGELDSVVLNSV